MDIIALKNAYYRTDQFTKKNTTYQYRFTSRVAGQRRNIMEKGAIKIPSGYYKEGSKKKSMVIGRKRWGERPLQNAIDSGAKNCSISFE